MHVPSLLSLLPLLLAATSTLAAPSSPSSTSLPPLTKRARKFQYFGINESGAEFGEANIPGLYGKDYIWPNLSTIPTFVGQGFNIFRVQFKMERLTPSGLTGAFDKAYLGNLTQVVNAVTQAGAYALVDPHNYGRFNGQVITSTGDFETFFRNFAGVFKGNARVIFDTNNEFHDEPGQLVADLNQAAINGIRASGATTQTIAVEGNAYSGAWTWTTAKGTDGLSNADSMGKLKDPQNKLVYQMHQYLDSDGSGTSATCVNSTIGSTRLVAATNWLRANGKKGLIGEFAGATNDVCEAAVRDMLAFMAKNTDVWTGALWWAAGPWWGPYMFSLEPSTGPAYNAYIPILTAAA